MIRKLEQADIDSVLDDWIKQTMRESGRIPQLYWDKKLYRLREQKPTQGDTYVYEQDGHIGGFMGLRDGFITGLFVVRAARGMGIGRLLIDKAKSLYYGLKLTVYIENQGAIRFYRRQGFKPVCKQIDAQTGRQELVMIWREGKK